MRALHLSTFDCAGGAAISALELVRGLREVGCDARMLVRDKALSDKFIAAAGSPEESFVRRAREASLVQRKLIDPNRTPVSNTWFSLPTPGRSLLDHPFVADSDILHLHWVSGYLSPGAVRQLQALGKPVVWTLHDQRPLTGGCHFSAGCRKFELDCRPCPQLADYQNEITCSALAETLRLIDPQQLTVVCPSKWMAGCARQSALFSRSKVETIPYAADTSLFNAAQKDLRDQLSIPANSVVLLAGADASGELRKGLHILGGALHSIAPTLKRTDVQVLAFGAAEPPRGFDYPVRWLGRISSREQVARLYRSSDAFLLPSTEDNLPNTMIEALCCGTPVLGFAIGGVPDAVRHGQNGLLAGEVSVDAYARLIEQFVSGFQRERVFQRKTISEEARAAFAPSVQANAYLALYNELLRGAAAGRTPLTQLNQGTMESPEFESAFNALLAEARKVRWRGRWRKLGAKLGIGRGRQGANG